ncbi:MAG: 3-oxoacyl-[acyl-carrier-protein] reductase [Elusimicrobiota bacterium]
MTTEQKVAVVTGGARGIGKAISGKLKDNNCKVVIIDIQEETAKQTAKEVQGDYFLADVSSMEDVSETVDKIVEKHSKIDILVNNAGITRDNLLIRMSEKQWDQVLDINLKGVFNFSKQVVKKSMMKNRTGNIVNIASIVGMIGNPGQANYSASKAGVIALTRTMAKELAKRKIRVNAVAPGFIETKMTEKLPEKARDEFLRNIPLGRLGTPQEVANAVEFLVSEDSSYLTGQVLAVDGGMVMN